MPDQTQTNQPTIQEIDAMQQRTILDNAVPVFQPLPSQGVNPTTTKTVKFTPKNVGLVRSFRVIVEGRIQNTDGAVDATKTPFGILNILSGIKFTDFNSYDRIKTTGWHIGLLNTARGRWPYGSALNNSVFGTPLQSVQGDFGANWPVVVSPSVVAHGTNVAFRVVYDIPLAYSQDDLRGAFYANVLQAQASLEFEINPTPFVATGVDDTNAVLKSGTCSFLGNLQFTVYQEYLDQLPLIPGTTNPILPILGLSTIYDIKQTALKGIVQGQDFGIPFASLRSFLSVFMVYNNTGGADGHGVGADINKWKLQSANTLSIFDKDPLTVAQDSRDIIGVDQPEGTYYFSFRRKAISTAQYGNMELVLNTISAGAGAYVLIGYEAFGQVNTLAQAGSLQ